MNYPSGFFQRMFAAARPLELSRRFAIYSGALLFLILSTAGAIIWAARSQGIRPYLIHISDDGEWRVFSERLVESRAETPWFVLMQESIAVRYAELYMRVPANQGEADDLWCACDDCADSARCRLCCLSDQRAFSAFRNGTMRDWQGMTSSQRLENIVATQAGPIDEAGGYWRITASVMTNESGEEGGYVKTDRVTIFVRIANVRGSFPLSLGFHVTEFLFYVEGKS